MPQGRPISRRTLLEWLGKGVVLGLGSDYLMACALGRNQQNNASGGTPGLHFAPGPSSGSIFANWIENTVDPQALANILASWTLTVDGLVDSPQTFTFADLIALPPTNLVMDFHCV